MPTLKDVATRMGITSPIRRDGVAIGIGALTVTPLELAQAYLPIFNGGMRVVPPVVVRVAGKDTGTAIDPTGFRS